MPLFTLSFRDVELLLLTGIIVSYETVRRWCKEISGDSLCRPAYAVVVRGPVTNGISMRCSFGSRASSIIFGVRWTRTVFVLDILVQPRRDARAGTRFFRRF